MVTQNEKTERERNLTNMQNNTSYKNYCYSRQTFFQICQHVYRKDTWKLNSKILLTNITLLTITEQMEWQVFYFYVAVIFLFGMYVCMYIRLKQLTYRNIDNRDNKRKSEC